MSDIAALLTWTNIRFALEGLGLTLVISALAIACSVVLGAVISIMRGSSSRVLRGFSIAYVELFKNTPLLLWIMFTFFVAQLPPLPAAVLAFTLFTAASVAEIVRGGLASVPTGQLRGRPFPGVLGAADVPVHHFAPGPAQHGAGVALAVRDHHQGHVVSVGRHGPAGADGPRHDPHEQLQLHRCRSSPSSP
ncbi:MAG: ABC transporter permease subunit [Adlercreutzia equolifaciens]